MRELAVELKQLRMHGMASAWNDLMEQGWVFRTNVTAGFGIVTEDFGPS